MVHWMLKLNNPLRYCQFLQIDRVSGIERCFEFIFIYLGTLNFIHRGSYTNVQPLVCQLHTGSSLTLFKGHLHIILDMI